MGDEALERILASLGTEDALLVSTRCEPAWKTRTRRLTARDEAVRAALAIMVGTHRYARLERMLIEHATGRAANDPALGDCVQTIFAFGEGDRMLMARTIRRIAKGGRSAKKWPTSPVEVATPVGNTLGALKEPPLAQAQTRFFAGDVGGCH